MGHRPVFECTNLIFDYIVVRSLGESDIGAIAAGGEDGASDAEQILCRSDNQLSG